MPFEGEERWWRDRQAGGEFGVEAEVGSTVFQRKSLRAKRQYAWRAKSLLRILRLMCLHCKMDNAKAMKGCKRVRCPLWPWRLVSRPKEGFRIARDLVELEERQDRVVEAKKRASLGIGVEVRGIEVLEFPWWEGPPVTQDAVLDGGCMAEEGGKELEGKYEDGAQAVGRLVEEAVGVARVMEEELEKASGIRKKVWGKEPVRKTGKKRGAARELRRKFEGCGK